MRLFLDTSALLSTFDKSDGNHHEVAQCWERVFRENEDWTEIIISDYILDELTTRIRHKLYHGIALKVLNILIDLISRDSIRLVWINKDYFTSAKNIFEKYDDQDFSFTDCTSFAICSDLGIQDVFTLDEHFATFGLTKLPSLLLD